MRAGAQMKRKGMNYLAGLATLALAGCVTMPTETPTAQPTTPVETRPVACTPASPEDPVIGNWLSKRNEKGIQGELRTLVTLQANGQMLYTEQVKRPRQPSQGLSEAGCWVRDGQAVVLQTLESNGLAVEPDDPLFTNRFVIERQQGKRLVVRSETGTRYSLEQVSPGYRLPF
jgi:uncharacterized protein (DUF736 family)